MTTETPVLPTFRDLTTWHLANLAGCGSPDRPDGIGVTPPARWAYSRSSWNLRWRSPT